MLRLSTLDRRVLLSPVLIAALAWGAWSAALRYAARNARTQVEQGFPAVAVETLERYRAGLAKNEADCRLLLDVYFKARRLDRLEWAAQACLHSGAKLPEAYLAMAMASEKQGETDEALRIVAAGIQRFDSSPDLFVRLGELLRKKGRVKEAANAYVKAVELAPVNLNLAVEVLELLSAAELWNEAAPVAAKLKGAPTDRAEIKLLLAKVFSKTGQTELSREQAEQGWALLSRVPAEKREALERSLADVLQSYKNKRRHW